MSRRVLGRLVRWAAAACFLVLASLLTGSLAGGLARTAHAEPDPPKPAASPPPKAEGSASSGSGAPAKAPGVVPLHIHVRGTAELHAVATADHGELTLHGELIDDAGTPVPGAHIVVQATSADDARAALRVGPLRPCDDAGAHTAPRGSTDNAGVDTDERGGFCVVGRAPDLKVALKLSFRGSKLYDAVDLSVPVEAAESHLLRTILHFEPPPETLDLDHESITITAKLSVDRSEAARQGPAGSAQRASLALTLTDERGARVAEAVTGGDGRARFDVKTTALAGPGAGELVVRFAGNAVLAKAEGSQPVLRRAEARLALAHPIERADAEDGVPIDVDVTAGRGPVSGGVVEVQRLASLAAPVSGGPGPSSESVGTAAVDEQGHAHVVAVFSPGGRTLVPLVLRYVPAAPWYRPGPELRVEARLSGPGVGRQLLLAAVVLAAAVWVVNGWRRSPRPPVAPGVEGTQAPPSGRAGVHVLASPSDLVGWRGTVTDAHDGAPVAGANLAIVAPSFDGSGVVARAIADERGAFSLEVPYRSDARLVVSGVEHSTHEQALPPPSVLGVALITRRRALLERLVRWARQKGAPFDGAPEPTPGHVRRVATRTSATEVEAWATRVENAAYGPDRVDEGLERDVRSAEPRALRSSPVSMEAPAPKPPGGAPGPIPAKALGKGPRSGAILRSAARAR